MKSLRQMPAFVLAVFGALALQAAQTVSLDGEWQLAYFPQPDGGAVRTLPIPDGMAMKHVKATVPGNCELDLVYADVLPPLEIGLNVLKVRPYEGYQWLYTKTFTRPKVALGQRASLIFEGIDTLADIFLNGEKIGEADNMLIPHSFDVTKLLKDGVNTVQVLIRSAFYESQAMTIGELGFHLGFADNEPFRKAAHMGGWDIFPRLYCAGLWRNVSIEVSDPVRIGNVAWICGDFNRDFTTCRVSAQFRVQGGAETFAWGNRIRIALSRGGDVKFSSEREYVAVQNMQTMNVVRPDLWWPRGMGEPNLYDATIEVLAKDGKVLARDVRKIGIRLVTLERDDVYGKDRPGQFLFRVNGEPCYVRGSNWVPLDAMPSRQAGRIIETLEMFVDLNCNMVRVWGGGVYEPETFFDWSDAHGLMVWQDFMTGCAVFPQGDEYAKATEKEVREVVLALRNHPSLVLWSGNNENDEAFTWHAPCEFRRNPNRDRSSRHTIPDVLYEFDVTRPYLPSSPYRPADVVAEIAKPSELHLWGARGYYKTDYYTNSPCWFASEMGYHGAPNRSSLERMMTVGCVYPWKGTPAAFEKDIARLDWNDEWRLKASNPYMKGCPGLWKRNDLMTNQIRIMFGGVATDLDTFIAQSQTVQAEAMKTFCELFRSRKFTRFNGLIWWNMRDGWPQLSDAVVDYYGGRKQAYFALKTAQRDVIACLVDDHSAWIVNDLMRPVEGHATYRDKASGKVLLDCDYKVPANGKVRLGAAPFSGQGLIEIAYTVDGGPVLRNHFLYGEPPFSWNDVRKWTNEARLWEQESE